MGELAPRCVCDLGSEICGGISGSEQPQAEAAAAGRHLKKLCKLWAPTWQKEVGWAPEAG